MLQATNKTKLLKTIVAYLAAMSVISGAYAQDNSNGVSTTTNTENLSFIGNIIDSTASSTSNIYPNGDVESIPQGSGFEYSVDRTDGYSGTAYGSYRNGLSFDSKYISTSSENITVLNVSAGFNAGAKLGCNGLDFGLEALFEFDAGDILEYLPKYILTNLATEALAQIYATPLVSAVMDGLKSMQNFTSEMKQASCNMTKIKSRANEIKDTRIQKCLDDLMDNGKATEAAMAKCEDPTQLAQKIQDIKESIANKESAGTSISKLLTSNGYDYGDPEKTTDKDGNTIVDTDQDGYLGAGITKGMLMKMFIPDVIVSANGGNQNNDIGTRSKVNVGDVYKKSFSNAYSTISGIYKDIIDSISSSSIQNSDDRDLVIKNTESYKDRIMAYGGIKVFTDESDDNINKYDSSKIELIEKQFESVHKYIYRTTKSSSSTDEFIIGPQFGVPNSTTITTDFNADAKDLMLYGAANLCFVKMYEDESETTYSWNSINLSEEAALKVSAIDSDGISDKVIEKMSACKALYMVDFDQANEMMKMGEDVLVAYFEYISAIAGKSTAEGIIKVVNIEMNRLISSNAMILEKQCEDKGVANMKNTAVYDGVANQAYKTCTDYVDQNKFTDEKIDLYDRLQTKLKEDVKSLDSIIEVSKSKYDVLSRISYTKFTTN